MTEALEMGACPGLSRGVPGKQGTDFPLEPTEGAALPTANEIHL